MRSFAVIIVVLLWSIAPGIAGSSRPMTFEQRAGSKSLPVKERRPDNSCAAYGAGFVKVEGTSTCVQIGGSISIGAGGSLRGR